MKVAAIQYDIAWENRVPNHKRILELITESKLEPNTLVVLPEMFDTGFSMNPVKTIQSEACESELFLSDVASEYDCCVVGGVIGRGITKKSSNEAAVFGTDGQEIARYRKMKPFSPAGEGDIYPAGEKHALFQFDGASLAPFICYDLRFPELFRGAVSDGAEIYVVIANWPAARSEHWTALLRARAIENQAAVIGVNRCGKDPNQQYDGKTVAFDPMGEMIAEADDGEQILKFEIDLEQIRSWREEFPAVRDMGWLL